MNTEANDTASTAISTNLSSKPSYRVIAGAVVVTLALAIGAVLHPSKDAAATPPALASVGVSVPVQRDLDTQAAFLGQYSAVDKVELRAQVGEIGRAHV